MGGAGGAWRFDYVRVVATWRERSQAYTVQVRTILLLRYDMLLLCLVTLRVWSRAVFVMGATVAVVWLFSLALGVWIGR